MIVIYASLVVLGTTQYQIDNWQFWALLSPVYLMQIFAFDAGIARIVWLIKKHNENVVRNSDG